MSKTLITRETGAIRIFDAEAMRRAMRRIAHEIIERNRDLVTLILVAASNWREGLRATSRQLKKWPLRPA